MKTFPTHDTTVHSAVDVYGSKVQGHATSNRLQAIAQQKSTNAKGGTAGQHAHKQPSVGVALANYHQYESHKQPVLAGAVAQARISSAPARSNGGAAVGGGGALHNPLAPNTKQRYAPQSYPKGVNGQVSLTKHPSIPPVRDPKGKTDFMSQSKIKIT